MRRVLPPVWFCDGPYMYPTLAETNVAWPRSKIERDPSVGVLDGSGLEKFKSTYGQRAGQQSLEATEAIHIAMLVSFMFNYLMSAKK